MIYVIDKKKVHDSVIIEKEYASKDGHIDVFDEF